jgi:hypothetical protein
MERGGLPSAGWRLKASALRGFAGEARALEIYDQVAARVHPSTRALMGSPPPASVWIDASITEDVLRAVEAVRGRAALRDFSRRGLLASTAPLLRPMVEPLLRLFGTSPATLFARAELLTATTSRGVAFAYAPGGARAGAMVVSFPERAEAPLHTLFAFAGTLEVVFSWCGVEGKVSDPTVTAPNAGRYAITW